MHFRTSSRGALLAGRLFNLSPQVKPLPTCTIQRCFLRNWPAADKTWFFWILWFQRGIVVITTPPPFSSWFCANRVFWSFAPSLSPRTRQCSAPFIKTSGKLSSNVCCRGFYCISWTLPGLRRVMPQPPPPAPVSLLWSPLVSVTRQRVSRAGCPTPITVRWCWLMSMSSYKWYGNR